MIIANHKKIYSVFLITLFFTPLLLCKSQWHDSGNTNLVPCALEDHYLVHYNIESKNHSTRQTDFGFRANNNSNSQISIPSSYSNNRQSPTIIPISQNELSEVFQWAYDGNAQCEYLSNAANFADKNFRAYARTLSCYNSFILLVHRKIHNDDSFKKATEYVPGFEYSHSLWSKTKSGFHDFINAEADRIKKEQENTRLQKIQQQAKAEEARIAELRICTLSLNNQATSTALLNSFESEYKLVLNQGLRQRYQQRIEALKATINSNYKMYDYSKTVKQHPVFTDEHAEVFTHCYGTALDKQLHEELCDTRTTALQVIMQHPNNFHAQVTVPMINYYTALAKVQKSAEMAFRLAGYSELVTQIIVYGIPVATKATAIGLGKAVKNMLDPLRWKNMAIGTVKLLLMIAESEAQEEERARARWQAALTGNTEIWYKKITEHHLQGLAEINALDDALAATKERLLKMSWDELLEEGVEIGATLCLDAMVMHAAGKFLTSFGNKMMPHMATLLKLNTEFSQECLVEIAGFGKLALEAEIETEAELAALAEKFGVSDKRLPNGDAIISSVNKSREIILPKLKTFEQARNKALELVGEIGADSQPYKGRLGIGKGKVVGRISYDKKVRWRLDYDPVKGPRINVEDFREGRGMRGLKVAIPFEGNLQAVESLLRHLNR